MTPLVLHFIRVSGAKASLRQSIVPEVVANNAVCDCGEDELHILCVSGACNVRVHVSLLFVVNVCKLFLNEAGRVSQGVVSYETECENNVKRYQRHGKSDFFSSLRKRLVGYVYCQQWST